MCGILFKHSPWLSCNSYIRGIIKQPPRGGGGWGWCEVGVKLPMMTRRYCPQIQYIILYYNFLCFCLCFVSIKKQPVYSVILYNKHKFRFDILLTFTVQYNTHVYVVGMSIITPRPCMYNTNPDLLQSTC